METQISVPDGFNFLYVVIFVIGMILHWAKKVAQVMGGWSKIFTAKLLDQFTGWFFNKFHATLIAGASASVMGVAAGYGLDVAFATVNALGIAISLAAGYIADSAFNQGKIEP